MKRTLSFLLSMLLLVTAAPFAASVGAATENASPSVLPKIREWTGGSGKFVPDSSTVLVYDGTEASDQIAIVKGFFADMLGLELKIASSGSTNAIIFRTDASACNGEEEGYTLVATEDSITVTAKTKIGLLYGGISIVQSIYADGFFPVGTANDWPEYPTRSGMVDVARLYMPIEELTEVTKYMAWFKLNEIQVHLNDNGKDDYAAFRLESDIEGLTAQDGHYTKDEYRAYQKEVLKYGVRVISEIDTPYHSACFRDVEGIKFLTTEADGVAEWYSNKCLNVSDETTVNIIKSLFTEYLSGDDPVFIRESKVVCVGVDEYPASYSADVVQYAKELIRLVNDLGYTARFWGGMGPDGCLQGAGEVFDAAGLDYQTNYWVESYSSREASNAMNADIINFLAGWLYIVPGSADDEGGYEDHYTEATVKKLYEGWWVERYSMYTTNSLLLENNENSLLGASFAIWNDYGSAWFGVTYHDVLDRFRESTCLISEKTWCGTDSGKKITYDDYKSRFDKLSERAGDADPFNRTLPEGGINLDLTSETEGILNGTNSLNLDIASLGFPNTLTFELILDELPSERTALFAGYDTEGIDIFIDPDGTLGFKSKINENSDPAEASYIFTYDYQLPVGEKTKITLTSDRMVTTLIVNDSSVYTPSNSRQSEVMAGREDTLYATLTIPLSKIGYGIKGKFDSISVSDEAFDFSAYSFGANLTQNATATASSCLDPEKYLTSNLFDGSQKYRYEFADDADEQWLLIDLGLTMPIQKIDISFNRAVANYEIHVSENGTDFTKVYENSEGEEGVGRVETLELESVQTARYIKYVQLKRIAADNTSGDINEISVFAPEKEYYSNYFSDVADYYKSLNDSDPRKSALEEKALALDELVKSETAFLGTVSAICKEIEALKLEEAPSDDSSVPDTTEPSSESSEPVEEDDSFDPLPVIIAVVAAIILIAVIVFVIKRKK